MLGTYCMRCMHCLPFKFPAETKFQIFFVASGLQLDPQEPDLSMMWMCMSQTCKLQSIRQFHMPQRRKGYVYSHPQPALQVGLVLGCVWS